MNFEWKGILGAVQVEGDSIYGWTTTPLAIGKAAIHFGEEAGKFRGSNGAGAGQVQVVVPLQVFFRRETTRDSNPEFRLSFMRSSRIER